MFHVSRTSTRRNLQKVVFSSAADRDFKGLKPTMSQYRSLQLQCSECDMLLTVYRTRHVLPTNIQLLLPVFLLNKLFILYLPHLPRRKQGNEIGDMQLEKLSLDQIVCRSSNRSSSMQLEIFSEKLSAKRVENPNNYKSRIWYWLESGNLLAGNIYRILLPVKTNCLWKLIEAGEVAAILNMKHGKLIPLTFRLIK